MPNAHDMLWKRTYIAGSSTDGWKNFYYYRFRILWSSLNLVLKSTKMHYSTSHFLFRFLAPLII